MTEFKPVGFDDVYEGDRVQFVSANNGFDGGDDVWRTGTVCKVTDKTVTVDCDDNSFGKVARLRRADWHYRCVSKSTKQPKSRPYRTESVQIVDMGQTVWALYIPNPEQAKDPQRVADNLCSSEYRDVELVASMQRHFKRDGAHFSGWVIEAPRGGNSDGIPTKRQAMNCLRLALRDHFTR